MDDANAECGMRNAEYGRRNMEGGIMVGEKDLKQRTKEFALRIIRLVEALPRGRTADVIGGQLLRSGTSVGSNYRSACQARSTADFISKMGIVEGEADESLFWMELLVEAELMGEQRVQDLMKEADEILAITVSSIKTAKIRKSRK
jgi:four helix bundle protein